MKFTKAKLLALLAKRANPYTGGDDLEKVKAYVAEHNLNFEVDGKSIDLDTLWAAKPAVTVTLDEEGEEDDTVTLTGKDADKYKKKLAADREATRGTGVKKVAHVITGDDSPQSFTIGNMERKSYNVRAARGETNCADADAAEVCGAWARLAYCNLHNLSNSQKALDEDICRKANVSYDFSSGGFVIPEVMNQQTILIRPRYRALTELISMAPIPPQGELVPRSTTDVTVGSTSEGVAVTESNPAGDQIKLTPFSMDVICTVTKKLLASSAINFGEFVVGRMQYAKDKKLEEIFFNGDGTSTYFNQTGIIGKFASIVTAAGGTWTTNAAYAAGITVAAGAAWSQVTYANLMAVFGAPAMLENDGPVQFSCSRPFFWNVMLPLMEGRGGTNREEVMNGVQRPVFQGVPGVYTNALPQQSVSATVPLVVGEFNTAIKMGTVPELTEISTSTEAYWVQRKMGFMFSAYHAINVHDIGNADSTAANRITGPLAALIMA